jgi:hypothetical protein
VSGGDTQRFAKAAHLRPVKVRSRGRLATFRKMQSPVALELLELLARSHIPQPDRLVVRPTDKQGGIRRMETDAKYSTAAIFSNCQFYWYYSRPLPPWIYASPPVRGGGVEPPHAKLATFRTMRSPVALERVQALAC